MIQTVSVSADKIKIASQEIYRYLGYGKNLADPAVKSIAEACLAEMQPKLSCRACFDSFPVRFLPDETDFGFTATSSRAVRKNLTACHKIILFTATVGFDVDRIIQKYSALSPVCALAAQAIGTAAIEAWCDLLCRQFASSEQKNGNYLRPRFSPGYGDLPLEMQKNVFRVLDCPRKIGVSLNESLLMSPSKSVSALVGVSKQNTPCNESGCEVCKNINCEYRRSTE